MIRTSPPPVTQSPPEGLLAAYVPLGRQKSSGRCLYLRDDCRASCTFITGDRAGAKSMFHHLASHDLAVGKSVLVLSDEPIPSTRGFHSISFADLSLGHWPSPLNEAIPPTVIGDIVASSVCHTNNASPEANRLRSLIADLVRQQRSKTSRLESLQLLGELEGHSNYGTFMQRWNTLPERIRQDVTRLFREWEPHPDTPILSDWLQNGGLVWINTRIVEWMFPVNACIIQTAVVHRMLSCPPALVFFLNDPSYLSLIPKGPHEAKLVILSTELPQDPDGGYHHIHTGDLYKGRQLFTYRTHHADQPGLEFLY